MKKEAFRSFVFAFLIIAILAIFSALVSASLTCEVKQAVCSQANLFHLSSNVNAHAQLANETGYAWNVCCELQGDALNTNCISPQANIANLSSSNNAHVEIPGNTTYPYGVCLSANTGAINCSIKNQCLADETCVFSQSSETNAHAADCVTDPYTLKMCCKECIAKKVYGYVKNTNNEVIADAKIDLMRDSTSEYTVYTNTYGHYEKENIPCGIYKIIASATGYIPSIKSDIVLGDGDSKQVDFTNEAALVPATTCQDDCTYAGDNLIHKECDGINNCDFCDEKTKEICNLAQPGWIRDYNETNEIECAEGCPRIKVKTKASVTCEEENLIKMTKLIKYKGKLVKLVIAVCG